MTLVSVPKNESYVVIELMWTLAGESLLLMLKIIDISCINDANLS